MFSSNTSTPVVIGRKMATLFQLYVTIALTNFLNRGIYLYLIWLHRCFRLADWSSRINLTTGARTVLRAVHFFSYAPIVGACGTQVTRILLVYHVLIKAFLSLGPFVFFSKLSVKVHYTTEFRGHSVFKLLSFHQRACRS